MSKIKKVKIELTVLEFRIYILPYVYDMSLETRKQVLDLFIILKDNGQIKKKRKHIDVL